MPCSLSDAIWPKGISTNNRLTSQVAGQDVVNEDLVNCTNWLPMTFRVDGGEWFNPNDSEILSFSRRLDLRRGVLERSLTVRDAEGRETRIESVRLASMADPGLAEACL